MDASDRGIMMNPDDAEELNHDLLSDLYSVVNQKSHLNHTCNLDIDQLVDSVRQTCIVCTMGTSWQTKSGIDKMAEAGMNVLLINLSTTPPEICKDVVKFARELDREYDYERLISVAIDVTAAPVTTGFFVGDHSVEEHLEEGHRVKLTLDEQYKYKCTADTIFIDTKYFPQLIHSLHKGDRVYLGDGDVTLIVKDVGLDCINCMVEEGGKIGSNKSVNIPRDRLERESVHAKYVKDLKFASECGVDAVFTSFPENASMIRMIRSHLPGSTKIFTKLETRESIKNLDELIRDSDGIVVGRSHLAMHYTPEKIFKLQKYIVGHCNIDEKPVFIIEQLLESMVSKPRSTRAESSDVANAVLDGSDGLILTTETSWGQYPIESVKTLDQICREAERAICHETYHDELMDYRRVRGNLIGDIRHVTGGSAVEAAASCGAAAIFVITTTGASALAIAASRPPCSVIGITVDVSVARHFHCYRGLHPYLYTEARVEAWSEDIDNRINAAIEYARFKRLVKGNDRIVVVTGSLATSGSTNTMQIFTLEDEHSKLRFVGSSNELVEMEAICRLPSLSEGPSDEPTSPNSMAKRRWRMARAGGLRYSVMMSRGNSVFGGVDDIRLPL